MAYEAMNNAEAAGNRLIVILNDNDMSIAPPVGGLSAYLAWLVSSKPFLSIRDIAKSVAKRLPGPLHRAAREAALTRNRTPAPFVQSCLEWAARPIHGARSSSCSAALRAASSTSRGSKDPRRRTRSRT